MPIDVAKRADKIATVSIRNPARRNALTKSMFEELADLWPRLAEDPAVRVVVLSGACGHFCAGADLGAGLDELPGINDLVAAALLKDGCFPKPIVAAIRGACVAGGLEMVLAADIRVAASDALFALPEVRWGIFPGGGAALKLADQIGYANAMTLLLTGAPISGVRAGEIGLVSHVAETDDVEMLALAIAAEVVRNSPKAVQSVKRYVTGQRAIDYVAREPLERAIAEEIRQSGERRIGTEAFLNKSTPLYDD